MTIIVAIDPGLTGAFAVMTTRGTVVTLGDLPVIRDGKTGWIDADSLLGELLVVKSEGRPISAIIERVHAMPKNGSQAAFSQGCTFGSILATLQILRASIEFVQPATWKKHYGLIDSQKSDGQRKRASLDKARLLFPDAELERLKDHGRAEALLIAKWYLQRINVSGALRTREAA